ncbi:hypothetical protein SCALM49S_02436 [Streptomyces californicus]
MTAIPVRGCLPRRAIMAGQSTSSKNFQVYLRASSLRTARVPSSSSSRAVPRALGAFGDPAPYVADGDDDLGAVAA